MKDFENNKFTISEESSVYPSGEPPVMPAARSHPPFRLVIMVALLLLIGEASVMITLSFFPTLPTWFVAFFDSAMLILLISPVLYFYMFRPLVRHIKERRNVEEKLIPYQKELQSLVSELSLTEERERRRLALDLHDSLLQMLAIANLKLDALGDVVSSSGPDGNLTEVRMLIRQAIQQTRSLTFDLSPPVLYQFGLEAALESLLERMEELHGIRIDYTDDNQPKPLTEDVRILLFRAVQELFVNVAKHAQVRNARLSISRKGDYIRIMVSDDGAGFDIFDSDLQNKTATKFGLLSINERLKRLGGFFEIVSKPGQGTQAILLAPLQHEMEKRKEEIHAHKDPSSRRPQNCAGGPPLSA